jgi:hypothetical protein
VLYLAAAALAGWSGVVAFFGGDVPMLIGIGAVVGAVVMLIASSTAARRAAALQRLAAQSKPRRARRG